MSATETSLKAQKMPKRKLGLQLSKAAFNS